MPMLNKNGGSVAAGAAVYAFGQIEAAGETTLEAETAFASLTFATTGGLSVALDPDTNTVTWSLTGEGGGGGGGLSNAWDTVRINGTNYSASGGQLLEFVVAGGTVSTSAVSGGRRITITPTPSDETTSATYVNALDFDADPSGVADSAPAIQAAIDSLTQSQGLFSGVGNGGTVFLPAGTYKLGSTLKLYGNCELRGASRNGTLLNYTPNTGRAIELARLASYPAADTIEGAAVRDLAIKANGSAGKGIGVDSDDTDAIVFKFQATGLLFFNVKSTCIELTDAYSQKCLFEDIVAKNIGGQLLKVDGNVNVYRDLCIEGTMLTGFTAPATGLIEVRGAQFLIEDCVPEPNCNPDGLGTEPAAVGIYVGPSSYDGANTSGRIVNIWNEMNDNGAGHLLHIDSVNEGVWIEGNAAPTANGPGAAGRTIKITDSNGVWFRHLDLRNATSSSLNNAITIAGSGTTRIYIDVLAHKTTDPGSYTEDSRITIFKMVNVDNGDVTVCVPSQSAQPFRKIKGSTYHDTDDGRTYVWNGTAWEALDNA